MPDHDIDGPFTGREIAYVLTRAIEFIVRSVEPNAEVARSIFEGIANDFDNTALRDDTPAAEALLCRSVKTHIIALLER